MGSLDILCCPSCKAALSFKEEISSEEIRHCALRCKKCRLDYPAENGIPRFTEPANLHGLNRMLARVYDRISFLYNAAPTRTYLRRRFWPSAGEEKARREVVGQLEIGRNGKVLETGVGTGDNVIYLLHVDGVELFGVDISIGMLKQCARRLNRRKLGIELFLANAEELPFRDESFDTVFHVGGINFFTDKRKAMAEMIRVAKAGTKIVIACETEKAIRENRYAIRLAFGKELVKRMLNFSRSEVLNSVPKDVSDMVFDEIWEGNGYLLTFRKSESLELQ
ncbi:MAG: methyltransferase domain-containing protein [Nitrospirota bacterium]